MLTGFFREHLELLPADAAAKQAKTDTQAAALHKRLKQIDTAQDSLIHDLHILPTDPADTAAHAMRKRIHAHFTDLRHQRETIEAQLSALAKDTGRGNDPSLLDELPELASRLDELPEHLQADLFAAFDIQVLWNAPMNQATFFATISDTSPGIITDLLTRASDDPTSAATPATSSNAVAGFTRLPIRGKLATNTVRVPTNRRSYRPSESRAEGLGEWPVLRRVPQRESGGPGGRPPGRRQLG